MMRETEGKLVDVFISSKCEIIFIRIILDAKKSEIDTSENQVQVKKKIKCD